MFESRQGHLSLRRRQGGIPITTRLVMTRTGAQARPALLEDRTHSAVDWFRRYSKQAAIGIVVAAAAVAIGFVVQRSNASKEQRAYESFASASRAYEAGNLPLARSDLDRLHRNYGGTRAGAQGRLLLAQVLFDEGKIDDGLKILDEVPDSGPLAASREALRAAGLELKGQHAQAAHAFGEAAEKASSAADRDGYRADQARALLAAGKKDEALAIWRALAADESSVASAEARVRIGEVTASGPQR